MARYFRLPDGNIIYEDAIDVNQPVIVNMPFTGNPIPQEGFDEQGQPLPPITPEFSQQTISPQQIQRFVNEPELFGASLETEEVTGGSRGVDRNIMYSGPMRSGIGAGSAELLQAKRDFRSIQGFGNPGATAQSGAAGAKAGLVSQINRGVNPSNQVLAHHIASLNPNVRAGAQTQGIAPVIPQAGPSASKTVSTYANRPQPKPSARRSVSAGTGVGMGQAAQGMADMGMGLGQGGGMSAGDAEAMGLAGASAADIGAMGGSGGNVGSGGAADGGGGDGGK